MQIRLATTEDVASISELYQACFQISWNEADIRKRIQQPHVLTIVIQQKNIVSFAMCQHVADTADIWYIGVHPSHQNHGYATALWQQLESRLRQQGVNELMIEVRTSNQNAIAFYQKMGCKQISIRKNYYRSNDRMREDALILRKTLA